MLRWIVILWAVAVLAGLLVAVASWLGFGPLNAHLRHRLERFLAYNLLTAAALVMLLPFYWMLVTSFKDAEVASSPEPVFAPMRQAYEGPGPDEGGREHVFVLSQRRSANDPVTVAPLDEVEQVVTATDGIRRATLEAEHTYQLPFEALQAERVVSLKPWNYVAAWLRPEESSRGAVNFGIYFWVSLSTGVLSTLGTLITSALAAYAFALMQFKGRNAFFAIVLLTMMVPGQVLLIPNFLILARLGLLDTYAALILPYLASVFTIFLMRQFFMQIPHDLWDAAQIDGSGRFRFLWQVVVPLSRPVFITAGLFLFLGNWNALLWPLIVTNSPKMRTLMVGLQAFNEEAGGEFHLMMAASAMAILPVVILFFFLQRWFIQGIARTGLK